MRQFGWLASVVIGISAITACTGNGEDDETEEPPDGVLNICQQWGEDEYEENAKEASEEHGWRDAATLAFRFVGCSADDSRFVAVVRDYSQVEMEEYLDAKAWTHPEGLSSVFGSYLGANGLLAGWATMTRTESIVSERDGDAIRSNQGTFGVGLAEVTHAEREHHLSDEFTESLVEIGPQLIELRRYFQEGGGDLGWDSTWELEETGPVVHGWSVLAPLLRFGDFHEDFLVPVATDIVEFDQEVDGDWSVESEEQISFDMFAPDATDAMEPVLEALSRNLDAAEQVFDATGDPRVEELLET